MGDGVLGTLFRSTKRGAVLVVTGVDFDVFPENYSEIVARSIRFSGERDEYFNRYKLACLKKRVVEVDREYDILDFGCGIGKLTHLMAQAFPSSSVYGFDISTKCIDMARARVSVCENVQFLNHFPVDHQYDIVTACNVFHHIAPDKRRGVLLKLKGVLKATGRIVIFEHNPLNPFTRYVVKICPFDTDAKLIWSSRFVDVARNIGMDVVLRRYIVFFPKFLKALRRFEDKLGSLPFGAQYMLVLQEGQPLDNLDIKS